MSATVLRPRMEAIVIIGGVTHEFATSLRDTIELKKLYKGQNLTGDVEDMAKLAHIAMRRLGLYAGGWDEFADAVEDLQLSEPPPLQAGVGSQASSQPSPEQPTSHHESSSG